MQKDTPIEYYWEFIELIKDKAKELGINKISLYLPGEIYNKASNAKIVNALYGSHFKIDFVDVNYYIDLRSLNLDNYEKNIKHNARKNLKIARKAESAFIHCQSKEEKIRAYNIIKENRYAKGYPLRMSLDQVLDTTELVKSDFFVLTSENSDVASAMVYYVNDEIAQVVYWGNIPETEHLKPINLLSYLLIVFYKNQGLHYLDIAISTEDGVPNNGLCSFKESIGCASEIKIKWSINL